ncbi:glycosyltransferase family 2 protein [Fictibacillus sp. S7]|uniref:glycosyltransferase family 2 protein n=1 Tax=Fictibacillus sp. S7 TaxID=2212476 RepID=UPI0010116583|nr:glycosyltransferase [Fictibacillus sp. S7]RXY99465.1 glycosyltransferase family 2 protein [Fictibacillus sp. S7]
MDKEVTVLIPSFNSGIYLREALESVFNQTYPNWKIILVDDASTDDSLSYAADLLEDQRITLIQNKKNTGQSMSQNIGLEKINTEFFLQLDADDWLPENTLDVLMDAARNLPKDVALIVGDVIEVTEIRNRKRYRYVSNEWDNIKQDKYDLLLSNYIPWPKFYRTALIKKMGGWATNDPFNGRHAEDLRMFLRLIGEYRFYYIPQTILNYRIHATNSTHQKDVYKEAVEWIVRDALHRWGNEYEPVFKTIRGGWRVVKKLKRIE